MQLTLKEVKRARWLQRRLKLLRVWFRIGDFLYKPWSSLKPVWDKWYLELKILRDKMILNTPPSQRIIRDGQYTAKEIREAADQIQRDFNTMFNNLKQELK